MAVEIEFFLPSTDIRDSFWFHCFPVDVCFRRLLPLAEIRQDHEWLFAEEGIAIFGVEEVGGSSLT